MYIYTHTHTLFFCSNTKYKIYKINTIYFHRAETKKKKHNRDQIIKQAEMQSKSSNAVTLLS